jgi:hypothetical protein
MTNPVKLCGKIILPCALGGLAVAIFLGASRRQAEPVYNGHCLSEWLAMYDASLRFEPGDGRYPAYTEVEIGQALDGIGTNALPFLKRWLQTKPDGYKRRLNQMLGTVSWLRFRFPVDDAPYESLAQTGFQYYGTSAQSVLPWLLKLANSSDPDLRASAYAAAFFTRPTKDIFLPLADRALQDRAAGCEEMAACWMVERFPDEAYARRLEQAVP